MNVTPFRQQVYARLREVPKGKVTTYGDLARAVGIESSQAIGQAMKHNPFAPEVPCHRVVRSDGSIGGFNGRTSGTDIRRKISLLGSEGVSVTEGSVDAFRERRHRF